MKTAPKEKILEAYTAIADGRVVISEQEATVSSSDGSKTYTVKWKGDTFASSDPASYWQGYPGYPIQAVLLLQGRLTMNQEVVEQMKGIAWKQLNDQYKRDYAKAAEEALSAIAMKDEILKQADLNNKELSHLELTIKRSLGKKKK